MIIINNENALRIKCDDVSSIEEYQHLRYTLEKELDNANRLGKNGIGLAAPQIGIAKNIAIIRLPKTNLDLINQIKDKLKNFTNISFTWVKAHNGDQYNEMADQMANTIVDTNMVSKK